MLTTRPPKPSAFTYLREKFPRLSEAKLKEGIFIGQQIRELMKDEYFDKLFQGDEKLAWDSFKFVVKGFWGNRRAQNYEELVNNLLQSYQKLGCKMSLYPNFLSPTNAPLYYTYKMLKYTIKIYHDCYYMFRSIWTIIREPMPNLAKITILCRYSVKIRR
jgi:hypothetical protein